ncbi:hypothetical protein N7455_012503 [Penicillium solitum]|uniref:uncharacterized protein n=1 Tax=Penicillium solitum TaxID=60172 RepID=UPI0032C41187|nr:hypothetical protein N7455_012503 [Penicillium solitum]
MYSSPDVLQATSNPLLGSVSDSAPSLSRSEHAHAGSGYLRGSTSELIYFASSAYGNDPDAPCSFTLLTKSMRYYPVIQTQSVLARAPTNPSMGVLLVVIAPAAELIVVTPSPPSTSSITLKPRGGSSTCFLTRTMAPWGRG